jgi:2-oxoisovalerate dehydrogenase E1 component
LTNMVGEPGVESLSKPKIFSEADFGVKRLEDALYQRIRPDGKVVGKDSNLEPAFLKKLYEAMVFARQFDMKVTNLSTLREIGVYAPFRGQEAAQVGYATAMNSGDWLVPMYRDVAAMITLGLPPQLVLQHSSGDERGNRYPQDLHIMPPAVPVATQLVHGAGVALAQKVQKSGSIVVTSTGDGGTSEGDFHEAMNFAGTLRLPVVFAIQNNQWAISVRRANQTASMTIAQKAVAYGFEGILADGNDVIASYEAAKYAVDKARRGGGPTLIEFYTYRMGPHSTAELVSSSLRTAEETTEWEKKDPIARFEKYLSARGLLSEDYRAAVKQAAEKRMEEVVRAYRSITPASPLDMFTYTYDKLTPQLVEQIRDFGGDSAVPSAVPEPTATGGKPGVNIRNAVTMALRQEMERDSRILIFGEDVGKNGGVFQATRGLQEQFGPERVFDTTLAEATIAGLFVGLSVGGMIPIAEIQFDGFTPPAMEQIFCHIARLRNRSRGRFPLRGVIRFPYGAGVRSPEHHSESPEVYFAHTPGLKVVAPSNPYDAKGLLTAAIREPNPVIFMEPKKLYDLPKMDVPEEEYMVPIGKAKVVRGGSDLTLISFGAMMVPTLAAADALQSERSVSTEVIDLRTMSPLDTETILKSARKTGRVVVVHEAPRNCGIGAEIAAEIADKALDSLRAPVKRVTGYDVTVPLAKMEDLYLPSKDRILKAATEVLSY